MPLDTVCLVEVHSYQPPSSSGGEHNAWFVFDGLPDGSTELRFGGLLFRTKATKERLNGTITYVRTAMADAPLSIAQLGVLRDIVNVEASAPAAGWARRTTTILLASENDRDENDRDDGTASRAAGTADGLVKELCDALSTATSESDNQWDIVPCRDEAVRARIAKDAPGKLVVILCKEASAVQLCLAALSEPAFLRSESHWHKARSARDRCGPSGHYDQLQDGVGELKKLARGAYEAVNGVVERVRREYRQMERSAKNIEIEENQLSRDCLRGLVEIRIRDISVAMQEAEVHLEDVGRELENAKWALQQRQSLASEYLNRMLMVVQVILIIATIWPQAFALYIDKETGGTESWPHTWTSFGYMLTVGIALSLLGLVVIFATKIVFDKFRGR